MNVKIDIWSIKITEFVRQIFRTYAAFRWRGFLTSPIVPYAPLAGEVS